MPSHLPRSGRTRRHRRKGRRGPPAQAVTADTLHATAPRPCAPPPTPSTAGRPSTRPQSLRLPYLRRLEEGTDGLRAAAAAFPFSSRGRGCCFGEGGWVGSDQAGVLAGPLAVEAPQAVGRGRGGRRQGSFHADRGWDEDTAAARALEALRASARIAGRRKLRFRLGKTREDSRPNRGGSLGTRSEEGWPGGTAAVPKDQP